MKGKLVLMEWLDSKEITNQWEYLDELASLEPSACESVGFLLEETDEYKTIARSVSDTQVLKQGQGETLRPHTRDHVDFTLASV